MQNVKFYLSLFVFILFASCSTEYSKENNSTISEQVEGNFMDRIHAMSDTEKVRIRNDEAPEDNNSLSPCLCEWRLAEIPQNSKIWHFRLGANQENCQFPAVGYADICYGPDSELFLEWNAFDCGLDPLTQLEAGLWTMSHVPDAFPCEVAQEVIDLNVPCGPYEPYGTQVQRIWHSYKLNFQIRCRESWTNEWNAPWTLILESNVGGTCENFGFVDVNDPVPPVSASFVIDGSCNLQ